MSAPSVNGFLLLDKPLHLSSNKALQTVKRLFHLKKAGHTGSLDPLATGVLPLCLGKATKFAQSLLNADKVYEVEMQLGIQTSTGDKEGEIIKRALVPSLDSALIEQVFSSFLGEQEQIPPMYSAIKHRGIPLYVLARQGETIERTSRQIVIHQLELLQHEESTIQFRVHCSKGTYIRTLVEDMAEALGSVAHVSFLRRISVSPFAHQAMHTICELEHAVSQKGIAVLQDFIIPVDDMLSHLKAVHLSSASSYYLKQGQAVRAAGSFSLDEPVRLYDELNVFLGLGEVGQDGRVQPKRLMI